MSDLQPTDFSDFFGALYRNSATGEPLIPMSWQSELASAACLGNWPEYICVPTGAGKTSTIDIALFALAYQAQLAPDKRTAPMRIFLVVDRRTVVSEAFYRAERVQQQLADASNGILSKVADRLRSYSSGTGTPVKVVELRGGIYRDPSWCDSLVQPMIVTSTVDQVGSRLLFRGYGVSESSRPIQAAAIAHDSLIILDEAHISHAFSETLIFVKAYQRKPWTNGEVPLPLRIVEMTATPPMDSNATKLEIAATELADPLTHIGNIVNTPKVTTLEIAEKAKGAKAPSHLATVLAAKAIEWANVNDKQDADHTDTDLESTTSPPKVIGIMCNMVATAKDVRIQLLKNRQIDADQVHLVIGAMRPIDRDKQSERLRELISTGADRTLIDKPLFVVATQCIEVGADYDFDALITEAAPIDSLIQRFGRLNRAGRTIAATGHIVIRGDRVKDDRQLEADDGVFKSIDPIYGNSMSYTWNWLSRVAGNGTIDFGIANFKQTIASADEQLRERMSTERTHAPVLLPAHLDLLCQTTMAPWPDPDVSLWLHGPSRNDPEVQVCWRADLVTLRKDPVTSDAVSIDLFGWWSEIDRKTKNIHAVSLCPPSAAECLSIPLRRVVAWLTTVSSQKRIESDLSSDLPSIVEEVDAENRVIPLPFQPIAWRGLEKSIVVQNVQDIRPGDTLVFPVTAGGWSELGYIPDFDAWSPQSVQGRSLSYALREAADEQRRFEACIREDFEKLTHLDCANLAFVTARNRSIIRLHPSILDLKDNEQLQALYRELPNSDRFRFTRRDCLALLQSLPENMVEGLAGILPSQLQIEYYADRSGIVVKGPRRFSQQGIALADDDGSDLYSRIVAGKPIELSDHLLRVRDQAFKSLSKLSLDRFKATILHAAETHDWGKADPRFQAMMFAGDLHSALWEDKLYAKSAKMAGNLQERAYARSLSELPNSFRHELLSVSLIEKAEVDSFNVEYRDLLLHLVASHHGFARPWPPICDDPDPPEISLSRIERPDVEMSKSVRQATCWHRIDSPIISRFWKVTRQFGWWGAAFLESVLRLADRRASQIENQLQTSSTEQATSSSAGANV